MRILYIGSLDFGGTCLQRLQSMDRLGYQVKSIDSSENKKLNWMEKLIQRIARKLGYPIDFISVNLNIIRSLSLCSYDVIWIDKGLTIRAKTLQEVHKISPNTIIVGYSPDDMYQRHSQSYYFLKSLKYYDFYITTKSYNVSELVEMGVKKPIFIPNSYAPEVHHPYILTEIERQQFGGVVGFIGAWEQDRADYILAIAEAGINVRWWGWQGKRSYVNKHKNLQMENRPLWGEQYSKAINSFDINLCFLRKINRDLQTTRSIEIPACGGFMLAERTHEHMELFKENVEACFFSTKEELIDKVIYYMNNPKIRREIAEAGRRRCILSGYSNDDRIKNILKCIEKND